MTIESLPHDAPSTAIAAMALWRVWQLERKIDTIMAKLDVSVPEKTKTSRTTRAGLTCLLGLLVLTVFSIAPGCAVNRPYMKTVSTNGTVQITKSTQITLGPGMIEVTRQRLSSGKTQTIGQDGVNEESKFVTTNEVQFLRELNKSLGK
jgi:hypothetical protein